jgi:hypothetical protein
VSGAAAFRISVCESFWSFCPGSGLLSLALSAGWGGKSLKTAFLIDWMLPVAVWVSAVGDISDVAVLNSSTTLVANFDKLFNIILEAPNPGVLGFGDFLGLG